MSNWIPNKLGNLLITINNKSKQVKSIEYATNGYYPIVDQSSEFLCGYHDDYTKVIDKDLPIIVFGDHTRHTKFITFPFISGADGTQLIKPKLGINDKFFYFLVSLAAEKIGSYGYDRHFKHLKDFSVFYPEQLDEQTKIAEVLSMLDRAIEQTEALITKQQRIKTGLMQDLLTKGIDEQGNIRSEATHAFKDSPLGRIPVEWEAKALDEYVRSESPICYGILMPGTGFDDGVPVIKVKDIFDGAICLNEILLTDPKIDAAYKRSRLCSNDLLITIRGTTGRIAIVPTVLEGANITQDTARIRLKDGYLSSYFFYLLQSGNVQAQIDLQTLGQAVKGINIAEVRKLRLAVPDIDEQRRVCQILDQVHSAWQVNVHCRDKLILQKRGLMHDLLTGKRRVTDLLESQPQ